MSMLADAAQVWRLQHRFVVELHNDLWRLGSPDTVRLSLQHRFPLRLA
jgi:hypothetical protein